MVDFLKNSHPDLGSFEDELVEGNIVDQQYLNAKPSYDQRNFSKQPAVTMPASEESPVGHTETVHCVVKWFNPVKGYGFVMPSGENEDIFMHFSVLDAAGYQYLGPGDEATCIVLQGDKGRQISEILEVKPARQAPSQFAFGYRQPQPVGPLEETLGEVKWFNTIRGFGFVKSDTGGRDIFIHASVLRRIGLQKIYPGQRVRMQVANSDNGRQAWTIELLDE